MKLEISLEKLGTMKRHAEETYPLECCGFFFGQGDEEKIVEAVRPVSNSKEGDQRRRFEISPVDYMNAELYAEENGLRLLGVYHSHPDHPARPSEHDRKQAVPFFSYIIISVQSGQSEDVTSWRLNDDQQFDPEEINVLDSEHNK